MRDPVDTAPPEAPATPVGALRRHEQVRADRAFEAVALVCAGYAAMAIASTSSNLALPSLVEQLGASTSDLQWIASSLQLTQAAFLVTGGILSDRIGRAVIFRTGLALLAAASIAAAWAPNPAALVLCRGVMGLAGALIAPAALSIIVNVVPEPLQRARAVGWWAAIASLSFVIGPILAGVLLQYFWWGSAFLVTAPFALVVLALSGRLPESRDPHPSRLDPVGVGLSIVGLATLIGGAIQAPTRGWGDPLTLGLLALGAVTVALFVWWERRIDHPMIDFALLREPRFSVASGANATSVFAFSAFHFTLILFYRFVLGFDTLESGLALVPLAVALALASVAAPRLVNRFGTKRVVVWGFVTCAIGAAVLCTAGAGAGYGTVLVGVLLIGVGQGAGVPAATESVLGAVPRDRAGKGAAMHNTNTLTGGAFGVAVLGSLLAWGYRSDLDEQIHDLGLSASVVDGARQSAGNAIKLGHDHGGPVGTALVDAGREAFAHGARLATIGCAVSFGLAAALAAWRLPAYGPRGPGRRPRP